MSYFTDLYGNLWTLWTEISMSNNSLDIAFKMWISIMIFIIFRMTMTSFRELKSQQTSTEEKINDFHSDIRNMQDQFNENISKVADCLKRQMEIEQDRYSRLYKMIQDINATKVADCKVEKLRKLLYELRKNQVKAVKELQYLADDLDKHFDRIKTAKIVGSAASIGGTGITIVGIALIPFSFGASLVLSMVGGAVSGAGGITTGGSMAVGSVLSSKASKSAKKILDDYNTNLHETKRECLEIGQLLNGNSENMEKEFPFWCRFWGRLVLGTTGATIASWGMIAKPILTSLRFASLGDDVGTATFRAFGVAGKGFVIAGGVVGILLLPLDISTLVDSIKDEKNKNLHEVSNTIRGLIEKIEKDCPTEREIEEMIKATFYRKAILDIKANTD